MRVAAVLRRTNESEDSTSDQATEGLKRRRSERRSLELFATTRVATSGDARVLIRDISPGGLLIEAATEDANLSVGDWIAISLPDIGNVDGRVVWTGGRFFGCEFAAAITSGVISAAILKAQPKATEESSPLLEQALHSLPAERSRIEPELNFATAFILSAVFWGIVAAVVYVFAR